MSSKYRAKIYDRCKQGIIKCYQHCYITENYIFRLTCVTFMANNSCLFFMLFLFQDKAKILSFIVIFSQDMEDSPCESCCLS